MEIEQKIENPEVFEKTQEIDEIKKFGEKNGGQIICQSQKENEAPNKENNIRRRHDEPSELSFEICKEKTFVVVIWIDDFISILIFVA